MGKQRVIDTIYFHGQEEIKVYFEVENEIFKARVYDEWIRDTNFSNLKQKIVSTVKEVSANLYKWIPVIEVEETGMFSSRFPKASSGLGFEIERYYLAKKEDGKWLRTDWDIEAENRSSVCQTFMDKEFKIPSVVKDRYGEEDPDRTFYIVYTEEKWAGFMRLVEAINNLKSKLRELVGTQDGQRIISEAGSIALRLTYKPEEEGKRNGKRNDSKEVCV